MDGLGAETTDSSPLKVMIVEDESIVAQHICEELLKAGDVIVAVSGSGTEAIQFAKINRPDIALIDIDISTDRFNSVKTATKLQRLAKKSPMLIVFTLTYPASHFPLAGAVDPYVYLNKPFSCDDLKEVLRKAAKLKERNII
ncbi:response regulator [bacterium]|nr:response regulator [bacterium]